AEPARNDLIAPRSRTDLRCSYKDQTIIEPFSPKTNVIVGRNGSGKSNFFAAVRFVLSDAYNQMGREERQALLHEGSGSAVMSAYVEVVFDNSDNRFPTNNPEMVIRRTIGLKKDEYSIDKKVSTKAEVMSMLETAGFSRSNPFYIVPQGRVAALTNMKESERLNLLKEVAGTKTYEARRLESLKIMAETNNKREKIDGLLEDVKERLDELEEEKEELRGFQEKDRERRCLEYAYYHQQDTAIQEALDEAEAIRQDGVDNTGGNRKAFMDGEKAISQMESTLNEMQKQLNLLQNERRQLEADRKDHAKARAKAELKVKGLADSQSARDQAKRQHDDELDTIRENIASKEKELSELLPAFGQRKAQELQVRQALDTAEAARNRLLTKQTRSSQFKNKAARDAHLKEQIQEVNLGLGKLKANRMDTDEQVKEAESAIEKLENQLSSLKEDRKGWQDSRAAMAEKVTEAQDRVDQLIDERKLLQREEYRLATMKDDAGKELSTAERG
ncbi:MAG: AAA family ATPase, partial [Thaumarchaeota archaeon]|nr:AAA family ATPase [Nitrososphaerota archaeon]